MNLLESKCCVSQNGQEATHNSVGAHLAGVDSKSRNISSQKENVSIS